MTTALNDELFPRYEGEVESPFGLGDVEILRDLNAVIQAVELKPVRLTKSGIPPKPLWTAINQRLLWKDPNGVLYDWEEADQVRFAYLLAGALDLIRPDADLWLVVGAGADQFFLASAVDRARLLWRAYLRVYDWDERCDARNEQGNRHNFGQTFRRDFVHGVDELREHAIGLLSRVPRGAWVRTRELARVLSATVPDLLMSEVCNLPEVDARGIDSEKVRFVDYWLALLCRFGWLDLGRSGGTGPADRLFRLTPLGNALFHGDDFAEPVRPAIAIDGTATVQLIDEPNAVTARYLARRLGEPVEGARRGQPPRLRFTRDSLARALDGGCDVAAAQRWLEARAVEPPPPAWTELFASVLESRRGVRIIQNAVALELPPDCEDLLGRLQRAGALVSGRLAIAAGDAVPAAFDSVGGEPVEAFDYPPDEGLGGLKAGQSIALHLYYEELPILHRDLLAAVGTQDDPPTAVLGPDQVGPLKDLGYVPGAVAAALEALTAKPVPPKVLKQIEDLWA